MAKEKGPGKITAPQCPVCGRFMDKVKVRVLEQLAGTGMANIGDEGVGWVCVLCMKENNGG